MVQCLSIIGHVRFVFIAIDLTAIVVVVVIVIAIAIVVAAVVVGGGVGSPEDHGRLILGGDYAS